MTAAYHLIQFSGLCFLDVRKNILQLTSAIVAHVQVSSYCFCTMCYTCSVYKHSTSLEGRLNAHLHTQPAIKMNENSSNRIIMPKWQLLYPLSDKCLPTYHDSATECNLNWTMLSQMSPLTLQDHLDIILHVNKTIQNISFWQHFWKQLSDLIWPMFFHLFFFFHHDLCLSEHYQNVQLCTIYLYGYKYKYRY